MKTENKGIITAAIIGAVVGAAGTYLVCDKLNSSNIANLEIISECREIIKNDGSPDFDDEKAKLAAINGYLKEGGDVYTYYVEKQNADPVEAMTDYVNESSTAQSSGFQVDISDDGNILVTEVLLGMAAQKQGITAGDVITHIDGVNVAETGYENIANKLLGKQDTEVELEIFRNGKSHTLTFKRDNEPVRFVTWRRLENNIGYMAISRFKDFTPGHMSTALKEVGDSDKFIIDMRGCPGGLTDACFQCADYFAGEGVMQMHRYNGEDEFYKTTDSDNDITAPVVILVNGGTASSGEIFTSLLKQYGADVTIVGEQTYGKGVGQRIVTLSDGGTLHYTEGYFTVGDWECWQGVGITPDVVIEMDDELIGTEEDIQLQKAIEILG